MSTVVLNRKWRPTECAPRYDDITFEKFDAAMCGLEGFSQLSLWRRARAYLLVCRAFRRFDVERGLEAVSSPSAVARNLESLGNSAKLIAKFASKVSEQSRPHELGLSYLVEAARNQALLNSSLGHAVVSTEVIHTFLELASRIEALVSSVCEDLKKAEKLSFDRSARESLISLRLPRVYETVFSRPFTMTISEYETVSHGLSFLELVLSLFGLQADKTDRKKPESKIKKPLARHTIKSHYVNARPKNHRPSKSNDE